MVAWFSLAAANRLIPDKDFDSTADNLESLYGIGESTQCLRLESVPLEGIDPEQRMDDESAVESLDKIAGLREAVTANQPLPPIYVVHHPGATYPYFLLEGMHRFSSYLIEQVDTVPAWVAHVNCCGRDHEGDARD